MKRFFVLALLLAVSGCSNYATQPTDSSAAPYSQDQVFNVTLAPLGTQFVSFLVSQTATVNVTLVSVTASGTQTTLSLPLNLAVGSLSSDGTSCTNTGSTTSASPSLAAQVSQSMTAGSYCVTITDAGSLPGSVDFGIRIDQSASATPLGSASPETFSTNVYPQADVTHTFGVVTKGTVTVNLVRVSPAASIGLGLGVPGGTVDCTLNTAVVTTLGGPGQLTASVDPGIYCVKVFDPGGLPGQANFQMTITHP